MERGRASQGVAAPALVMPAVVGALNDCTQRALNINQVQAPEQGETAELGGFAMAAAALTQVAEQRVATVCTPLTAAVAGAFSSPHVLNATQVHGPAVQGAAAQLGSCPAAEAALTQLGEQRAARACRAARKPWLEDGELNRPVGGRKSVRERRPPPQHEEYMEH